MSNQQTKLEEKNHKLKKRYKALGKSHGRLCQNLAEITRQAELLGKQCAHMAALAAALQDALKQAKRSYQPAAVAPPQGAQPLTR